MTFPSKPAPNLEAILAGPLVAVGIAPWTSNYGYTPSSCVDLGALKDITISRKMTLQKFEADNILAPVAALRTDEELVIKAKLLQSMELKHLSMLTGSSNSGSDVSFVSRVPDTTDGTATWGRGSVGSLCPYTLQMHIEGLALDIAGSSDVYTKADIIFPKVVSVINGDETYKKNDLLVMSVEFHALYDSSVSTAGLELFKIVLTAPK